jgi:predicted Zn-dependent protease
MGCTEEPYLQGTPQPHLFLSRFVLLGFSFGEAAYACQEALSWQNTVVGDPLYRPFALSQQQRFKQLEKEKSKDFDWVILMWINFRLAQGATLEEIEKLYAQNPDCKKSAVLQEKLGDLYRSRGKLFEATEPYARALTLPMNSLQKLRVSLSAADAFSAMGKDQEAYDLLKSVLREYPAYPAKKEIYESLQKIARNLRRDQEAAEFDRLARES